MKKEIRPEAIRIISVKNFEIIVFYNTGEYRKIDFKKLFKTWEDKELVKMLNNKIRFESIVLDGHFTWTKVKEKAKIGDFVIDDYLTIGSDTLYEKSEPYIMNDITQYLKDMRELKGITQTQLAKKIKVNPSLISNIENKKAPISMKLLSKITNCLV